jgi:ABC-type molybdate transport system ATPase subunit
VLIIHNREIIKNADQIILMSDGRPQTIDFCEQLLSTQDFKSLKLNQNKPNQ